MFVPYTVDVPMARLPLANWGLILVTCLVSFAILARDPTPREEEEFDPDQVEAFQRVRDGIPPLALKPSSFSIVQLFSYVLVHGDLLHLAGNMLFLFVFGNAINAKLGQGLFLGCYFFLGAVGGLGWLLLGNGMPLVGASGAIMGLVGMFLILFPRNDVQIWYWFGMIWTGVVRISSGWVIAFYMGCDLYGVLHGGNGGIAYVVHLVGALVGMSLAIVFLRLAWLESSEYEENLLQVLGFQKPHPRYQEAPPEDDLRPRKKRKKVKKSSNDNGWG